MAVDNKENFARGFVNQALEKCDGYGDIDAPIDTHESAVSVRVDCRDDVESEVRLSLETIGVCPCKPTSLNEKKLIALAVAAGLFAPAVVLADAKVYGVAHVSIDSLDDGTDSNMNVSDNASRLGFKGSKDVGGDLKANFQIEATVHLDSGGVAQITSRTDSGGDTVTDQTGFRGWLNNRNSYVGLSGGFGEIRIGTHDTPFKDVRSKIDVFGDRVGDFRNLTQGWDRRFNNSVYYISPKLGGVATLSAMYSTNTGATATGATGNDTGGLSLSVQFVAGSANVWVAHESHNFVDSSDESGMRVGAKMGFGAANVGLFYHSLSDLGGVSGTDTDLVGANVAFKMGKNILKAQYAMVDPEGNNNDADMMVVGFDHSLNKSTTIYAMYAQTDNGASASFSVSGGGGHEDNVGVSTAGKDPSAISVGLIHEF